MQPEFAARYQVLGKKLVNLSDSVREPFKMDIKCSVPISYDASTTSLTDLATKNILVYTYAISAPTTGFNVQSRISFQDE